MFIQPTLSLKSLADDVLRLSDFFIQHPEKQTPWNEAYCQRAYRYYFLPLNYIRNELVIRRGQQIGFFENISATCDWGAGPGTASLALAKNLQLEKQILIENSAAAEKNFHDLQQHLKNPQSFAELQQALTKISKKNTLLVFSYSLTERADFPLGWEHFEAVMILEPSTQQDGRRLLHWRQKLIEKGYFMWAPCTHQHVCPLLAKSKTDWCHDRTHVQAPDWFRELETHLPVKNRTVTTSYLLAKKIPSSFDFNNKARLTGDSLPEKGKTRQLLCRGPEREFLTWMHKDIEPETRPRGELIDMPLRYECKSNEVRVKK